METIVRLFLTVAFVWGLWFGIRKLAAERRLREQTTEVIGFTMERTMLVVLIVAALLWWLHNPSTASIALPLAVRKGGFIVFILGWALRVWAQITLGEEWSVSVRPRPNGHLVKTGPYRWMAHPIYYSYLPIAAGGFAATGSWLLGGLAFAYAVLSLARIPLENRILAKHPDEIEDKNRRFNMLILTEYLHRAKLQASDEEILWGRPKPETTAEIARLEWKLDTFRSQEGYNPGHAWANTSLYFSAALGLSIVAINFLGMITEIWSIASF